MSAVITENKDLGLEIEILLQHITLKNFTSRHALRNATYKAPYKCCILVHYYFDLFIGMAVGQTLQLFAAAMSVLVQAL